MQPYSPDDNVVNALIDNAGGVNFFGIRPAYKSDVKYLMTQTESRPRLPDEDIIAALKGGTLQARAATHRNYWAREEQKQQTETTAKKVAKEIATRPLPGGNTPTPLTGTPTDKESGAYQILKNDPVFEGKPFIKNPDGTVTAFAKSNGNPQVFDVSGNIPKPVSSQTANSKSNAPAGYEWASITDEETGQTKYQLVKVDSGGGGGGGYIPPATTYSVQQIGGKVYSLGSDRSVVLLNIDPGYAKYEVNRDGTLVGFRADGSSTELQKGWDFAKQDPALVVKQDARTGESLLVNTRNPSQPPQSLGTFDFAAIDPERTTAESAFQSRLGVASSERASDQSAALSGRATDISGAGTARSQDITLQGQQFNNALDLQKYVNGLINNPTDFVNRARLSAGLAPLGGGMITQADLVNAAKNAMGSQNFQTVRDAFLPAPFVTAPKTALPQFAGPAPVMPRGAANVPVVPPVVVPKVTTEPTPVTNPTAPTAPQWALDLAANPAYNGSTPTPVTRAAAPAATLAFVDSSPQVDGDYGMGGVPDNRVTVDSSPQVDGDYGMGAAPAFDSSNLADANSMNYGGATRDPRFIVGDRRDGQPTGNEEMIINPTRAPIQVVPNSRLAAYYGGTMPNRFAGGTNSRLGMYPMSGYARGTGVNEILGQPTPSYTPPTLGYKPNPYGGYEYTSQPDTLDDPAGQQQSREVEISNDAPLQTRRQRYLIDLYKKGYDEGISGVPMPDLSGWQMMTGEDASFFQGHSAGSKNYKNSLAAPKDRLYTAPSEDSFYTGPVAQNEMAGYANGTNSRLGMYPRYADGVLPSVQGAPVGSLSPVTQQDLVNSAREYSPPAVGSLLGDRGAFEARMLPVQSASMRQTNNLTPDETAALGTRLALEGTSQQEYNALQKGLFGQQRTTRRGRLVV